MLAVISVAAFRHSVYAEAVCPAGYTCTQISKPTDKTSSKPCSIFPKDLTINSSGPEVAALQAWLISNGYDIPAITSGRQPKGFFGYQSAQAVTRYQAKVGVFSTGYFGPITRAKINASCTDIVPTNPMVPMQPTMNIKPTGSGASGTYAAASPTPSSATISSPTVTPVNNHVSSGSTVTVKFGNLPSNLQTAKFLLDCPAGVSSPTDNESDLCGQWLEWSPTALSALNNQLSFILVNNGNASAHVVPNFYVYTTDRPDYAVGGSSDITVDPAVNPQTSMSQPVSPPWRTPAI